MSNSFDNLLLCVINMYIVNKTEPTYCNSDICFYAQCWNASWFKYVIVTRMPQWIPVPVDAPHTMTLFRQRRDFGITAAIITAISLPATGAATGSNCHEPYCADCADFE